MDAPVLQEPFRDTFCDPLPLAGKEFVVLPQGKAAGRLVPVSLTVETLQPFHHTPPASGAGSHRFAVRSDGAEGRRQCLRVRIAQPPRHVRRHRLNTREEHGGIQRSPLHLFEFVLPLCRQLRGFDFLREDADQRRAFFRGEKRFLP